jgi:hypothetical protein
MLYYIILLMNTYYDNSYRHEVHNPTIGKLRRSSRSKKNHKLWRRSKYNKITKNNKDKLYVKKKTKKYKGGRIIGTGYGSNCNQPNFSIYNTNLTKLFPYKP